jgi:glycosyltransferase involved in cell wall biosynthesis
MPLRIGIDALSLRPGAIGGGEMYVRGLVEALARVDEENEYHLFATPRAAPLFAGLPERFRVVACPIPGGRAEVWARLAWQWAVLGAQARRRRLDVVHFTSNLVPPRFPAPSVLTVHDFSSLFYRERLDVPLRASLRLLDRERLRSIVRASRVAAISRFTADETRRRTAIDPARLSVVHSAHRPFAVPSAGEARRTVARHGVEGPFLLSVATLNHHKNLARLLEAYARLGEGARGMPLVLVGRAGTASGVLRAELERLGIAARVALPGYVSDDDLPAFYRAASLYVFPSLYEGFGMPLLEAAACGTPVAAARAGSLPEIGGDAALYFDPWSVDDMARVLGELVASEPLRRELGERGRARAAQFGWDRTAREMASLYAAAAAAAL